MEEASRSFLLLLTFLAIIYWAAHQPKKVDMAEVKYCPVMYWTWVELAGAKVKLWHQMFGPCSDMDRYEQI